MAFTHDLKTSLTSLRLQAEALREDVPEAAGNPNLQRMLKDSVRLQLQLENALALATTDGAVLIEAIDICALVEYLRDDFPELQIDLTGGGRVLRRPPRARERAAQCAAERRGARTARRASRLELHRRSSGVEIVVSDDGSGDERGSVAPRSIGRSSVRPPPAVRAWACTCAAGCLNQMHGRIRVLGGYAGLRVSIELPEAV